MKNIIAVLMRRAGARIFHTSSENPNLCVVSMGEDVWKISFEGVSVAGKIYVSQINQEMIVFEIIMVDGQRNLIGLRVEVEETEDTGDIVEAVVRKAGQTIFHVSPATLYVNSPQDGIWAICFEGVSVIGKVCVQEQKAIFEAIKVEGEKKLIGLRYTI
ncbi:MAG: hypothetical protein PHY72_02950 [Candidatus Pacebacteria bacterium]|nr:hypothetical protein [Candidatus Paceibacterota bacterium]